jgi:adenine phosphoribosyltransferase
LGDVNLSKKITVALAEFWNKAHIDVTVGIESRGFLWGHSLAQYLEIPFVPVRKKGKLPADSYAFSYELEYGFAEIEIHKDAIVEGQRVLIHDDLLATGGTAVGAAELIKLSGGEMAGFSFIVELSFLGGREKLDQFSKTSHALSIF